MSDFLAAAVAALPGVPDQLVLRSASARATAQGVGVDDVLQAWSGGGSLPGGAPAAAPAAAKVPAAASAPAPAAKAAPAASAVVPTPVTVEMPDDEDPIDPPLIGARLRQGLRLGGFMGALGGFVTAMYGISSTFDAVGVTNEAVTVTIGRSGGIIAFAAVMAVAGIVIANGAVGLPAAFDRNFSTENHPMVTALVGVGSGGVLGAALGAFVTGTGSADALDESLVHVPVGVAFLTAILGGAVVGALVGMIAQAAAVPAGLEGSERDEALAVRKRLATGYIFPALVLLAIGGLVVSLGTILLTFHAVAPIMAVVVAGAILMFAFLSGGRPRIRAGKTEVVVVLATLAVLVYFLVIINNAMFGTGH